MLKGFEPNESRHLLMSACRNLFKDSVVFFHSGADVVWPDVPLVNVILWGDGPSFLAFPQLWPSIKTKIRLWCLSHAHARVMAELWNLREGDVGVIPRDALVPKKSRLAHKLDFGKPMTLLLSSRPSENKNYALSLAVAHELQQKLGASCAVWICGQGLNEPEHRRKVQTQIRSHAWKQKPSLLGDLGAHWHLRIRDLKVPQPVLMNLSTYGLEDFGVSVAQADSMGWPLILSEWGSHLDIQRAGCLKIPTSLIKKPKAAKAIAMACLTENKKTKVRKVVARKPRTLTSTYILARAKKVTPKRLDALNDFYLEANRQPKMSSRTKWQMKIEKILATPW